MSTTFNEFNGELPYISSEQMMEVDRAMIEDYGIQLVQMMENAGRNLAHLARVRFLENYPQDKKVILIAGPGGNGGGALVCARRLHNYGVHVKVVLSRQPGAFTRIPSLQLHIIQTMGIPIKTHDDFSTTEEADLIIDGLIGYSLKGPPYGGAALLIQWANSQPAPILSLDVPSGIDTTSGNIYDPAIKADATMTLALPKQSFLNPEVMLKSGELYLADISVPPQLYNHPPLNLKVTNIFTQSDIVRIYPEG